MHFLLLAAVFTTCILVAHCQNAVPGIGPVPPMQAPGAAGPSSGNAAQALLRQMMQQQQMQRQMQPQGMGYQMFGQQNTGTGSGGNDWINLMFDWYREGLVDFYDAINLM